MAFSAKYIDHFSNPRGIGEVVPPDLESDVEHEGDGCLDKIRLSIRLQGETITQVRFRARACSGTIAACSALVELTEGKSMGQAVMVDSATIERYLEGVPAKKRHSVELAARALSTALRTFKVRGQ